ncbi:MAG: hypothetical protein AAB581_01305, partial [Patescibacteria group bacterium]
LPQNQWVQYRVGLGALDTAQTPTLDFIQIYYQVDTPYDFTLTPSSASASIVQGGTVNGLLTMTVTVTNGSAGPATTISYSSPGGGPTISPGSCTPATGTCVVDMNVNASSAALGSYTITATGSNGTLTRYASFTVTVDPAMDFSLRWAPTSQTSGEVIRGYQGNSNIQTVVELMRNSGAVENVFITADEPAGVVVAPEPVLCSTMTTGVWVTCASFTISAAASAATGNPTVTFTGVTDQSGTAHTVAFALRVRTPLAFSLSNMSGPAFQGNSVTRQTTGTYGGLWAGTEQVNFVGFSSTSNPSAFSPQLASDGSQGVISVSFSGGTCTLGEASASCQKSVTVTPSTLVPVGQYVITITGTPAISGSAYARQATFTLTVDGPFDFSLSCGGCAGSIEQGQEIVIPVTVSSPSAVGASVSVSVSGYPVASTGIFSGSCTPYLNNPCTATLY